MIHLILPPTAHEFIKDMQGEQVTFKEVFDDSQQFVNIQKPLKLMFAVYSHDCPISVFCVKRNFSWWRHSRQNASILERPTETSSFATTRSTSNSFIVKSIASLALISQNLFFIFPINFLIAFCNKGRKAGHDLISRTSVVPGFLPDDDSKKNQHQ